MPSGSQITFAGGEVGPPLWGRVDLARYATALRRLVNGFVHPQGGASNRAGLEFTGVALGTSGPPRLLPFEYNTEQAYVIELGDQYFRIFKREGGVSGQVLEPAKNITGATNANPCVITCNAHGFLANEWVLLSNLGGMPRLHGLIAKVGSPTANTFEISDYFAAVNTTSTADWGVYTSGGTAARLKTVATAYLQAQLSRVNQVQSADVMRLVHQSHAVRELTRGTAGHYDFSIADMVVGPRIGAPTSLFTNQDYGIGIYNVIIAAAVQEVQLQITPKYEVLKPGERIRITGNTVVTELNDKEWIITRTDPGGNHNDIHIVQTNGQLIDTTAWAAGAGTHAETGSISTDPIQRYRVTAVGETGEESLASVEVERINVTRPADTAPVTIKWRPPVQGVGGFPFAPVPGLRMFHVYKDKNGVFGYIGTRNVEPRTQLAISAISSTNPVVVTTSTNHGWKIGDKVYLWSGFAPLGFHTYMVITVPGADQVGLGTLIGVPIDGSAAPPYTPGATDRIMISDYWFEDDDIAPDLTDPAPPQVAANPFSGANKFPAAVAFHEQRGIFAGTLERPQTVWATQPGNIYNFNQTEPSTAEDAIEMTLPGRRANAIRHLLSLGDPARLGQASRLLIFTGGTLFDSGSGDGGYLIENIRNTESFANGCAWYPAPLAILDTVLYVEARRNSIWDLGYQLETGGSRGEDRTLASQHIFERKRIVDWAYAQVPDRLLWVVLDDGTFASMTYVPEQGVFGWARHETDGFVEAVVAIPEDGETGVYFVVRRGTLRCIERLRSRAVADVRDAFHVDSGLTLDVPVLITGATQATPVVVTAAGHGLANGDHCDLSDVVGTTELNTMDGGQFRVGHVNGNDVWLMRKYFVSGAQKNVEGITQANPAVVTATAHGFPNGAIVHLGNVQGMTEVSNKFFKVAGATANTFQLQTLAGAAVNSSGFGAYTMDGQIDLAQQLDGTAFGAYASGGKIRKAVTVVRGLWHLIGRTVRVVANGTRQPDAVVNAFGEVTLTVPASRVHVGLGYRTEIETLDINSPTGAIAGTLRNVKTVVPRFYNTAAGVRIGPNANKLDLVETREFEGYNELTRLAEGEYKVNVEPDWNRNGRVLIRMDEPAPMTVLGVSVKLAVGDR